MADDDFWIEPAGVDDQARSFEAHAELMNSASDLLARVALNSTEHGDLYNKGVESGKNLVASLTDWFSKLASALTGVAKEIQGTSMQARKLDLDAAANLDALDPTEYNHFDPGAPRKPNAGRLAPPEEQPIKTRFPVYLPPNGGASFYCDAGPQFEAYNNPEKKILPDDILSPSGWIDVCLSAIGGGSLAEDVTALFGGPWGDLYELAYVLNGLQKLLDDSHSQLTSTIAALGVYWQGYSANSAQEYFSKLLKVLSLAGELCFDSANAFKIYTDGVYAVIDTVTGQIQSLTDLLIVAAITAAAGAATSETGIGAVAGFGLSGLSLLAAAGELKSVWDALQNAKTLASGLDTIQKLSAQLDDFTAKVSVPEMTRT